MASKELFSLGAMYPSDFLKPYESPRCYPIELKLMMEDNGLVHLEKTAPKEVMWGEKYWYRSSTSTTMRLQLKDVVDSILGLMEFYTDDLWVDIAGNDAYMLSQVPEGFFRVNIDPVNDSYREEIEKNCDFFIQDYFTSKVVDKMGAVTRKAKVVTCVSMFYDVSEPDVFLQDVYNLMEDDALFVLQLSYTPLMMQQLEFSNICHEHLYYYSFYNIKPLLEKNGFRVMDIQLNNTNAGSFRLYLMKDVGDVNKFSSQTYRDVCNFRINSILCYEQTLKLSEKYTWLIFFDTINGLKELVVSFIKAEKGKGKTIMGYAASTKFNTALQYFGLTNNLITAIADRNQNKHGLMTIGTNIPIISEEAMRLHKPDYLLIGAGHFLQEFKERERAFLQNGGKFILFMPRFEIISI